MPPSKKDHDEELINNAVKDGKTISIKSYVLGRYGEELLEKVSKAILDKYGKSDLLEILYPSAKELAINATKASLKRLVFSDLNLDPEDDDEYKKGMEEFKQKLTEEGLNSYKSKLISHNLPTIITFYYNSKVVNIKVKNMFRMLPIEEQRVREKFRYAESFSNLLEFYLAHGDEAEGMGLGITMVGILLDESGFDRHQFTLHCKGGYNETAAKLEIPISDDYITKRERFEIERKKTGMSVEEFRKVFR